MTTPTPTPSAPREIARALLRELNDSMKSPRGDYYVGDIADPNRTLHIIERHMATALATAEAAGWRAGVEAADRALATYGQRCFERGANEGEPLWGTIAGHVSLLRDKIRTLTPPESA